MIVSSPTNAKDAFGLTDRGREQVRQSLETAQASGNLQSPIVLISSPLLRARESAEVAAELLGGSVTIDARLSERGFGSLELEPDDRYEQVWTADRIDATHRSWGVESVADVLHRVDPLVQDLTRNERIATAILCTHGDVASTLLCASLHVPLERHREVGALDTGTLHELGVPMG